jgi:hypothetical protein
MVICGTLGALGVVHHYSRKCILKFEHNELNEDEVEESSDDDEEEQLTKTPKCQCQCQCCCPELRKRSSTEPILSDRLIKIRSTNDFFHATEINLFRTVIASAVNYLQILTFMVAIYSKIFSPFYHINLLKKNLYGLLLSFLLFCLNSCFFF